MANPSGGLGRGLSSLIPDKKSGDKIAAQAKNIWSGKISDDTDEVDQSKEFSEKVNAINYLPLDKIIANPYQPREHFSHTSLEELIASIKEHGILQPLVVAPKGDKYELIAGERRLRASQFLELPEVPAIIRKVSEQEQLELSLIENIQRQDLNPIEEARAYQRLIDEFNLTQEEVAKQVGKSRPKVANSLRILNLPVEVQEMIAEGKITEGHAKVLLEIDNPKKQLTIAKRILRQNLTVRDLDKVVDKAKGVKVKIEGGIKADSKYNTWEKTLQSILGTKVSINDKKGKGNVVIEYFSEEELQAIVERLSRMDDL